MKKYGQQKLRKQVLLASQDDSDRHETEFHRERLLEKKHGKKHVISKEAKEVIGEKKVVCIFVKRDVFSECDQVCMAYFIAHLLDVFSECDQVCMAYFIAHLLDVFSECDQVCMAYFILHLLDVFSECDQVCMAYFISHLFMQ